MYTYEDKAYFNKIRAIERAREHEHSPRPEDNQEYKVVLCHNSPFTEDLGFIKVHETLTVLACCAERAQIWAESMMRRLNFFDVETSEIWDTYDLKYGEPGEIFYPDNHIYCKKAN